MEVTKEHSERNSEEEFVNRLSMLVDAGAGIIHVRATETLRAVMAIRKAVVTDSAEYREWDIVNGFRQFTIENWQQENSTGDENVDLAAAFSLPLQTARESFTARESASPQHADRVRYFVFINPHPFMENNPHLAHLIALYAHLFPTFNICVLLVTPDQPLPEGVGTTLLSITFHTPGLGELREALDGILETVKDSLELTLDESDTEKLCYLGAGMTKQQFESHVSLSIVETGRAAKNKLDFEDIAQGVNNGKMEVVNTSDILELYPSANINNIGGMENLKDWIRKRARCYSDEAKAFGIEPPKGMVFVGPPGCLHGDTIVDYRRGVRNSGRPITLSELYRKFNGLPTHSRGWDTTLPTFLHSLDSDGVVFYNRVVSVIEAGVKTVITVVTDHGKVTLTPDHPIAQPGGSFVAAGTLSPGDTVLIRGSMKPTVGNGRRLDARPPRRISNVRYHPYGSYHEDGEYYAYKRVPYARLVVEAHMNDLPVDEYVHALKYNAKLSGTFTFLPPDMEVHHVDEDTMNDSLSNLMVMDKAEHSRTHSKTENFNVEYVQSAKVLSIENAGEAMTYDVQMDLPANNFVANGFIVHNTGKSLAAKAVSAELGVPLVRLDFGRVFNSLVGASEQRIRKALSMVESMAPVVLFCDEIDKGLGGIANGSGGDSGTSMRVLGSFLTWLQDSKYPVFTMVTANNIDGLPPELLRRGRFDAIFATNLPTPSERFEVLRIHLALRGRDIADYPEKEVNEVIDASNHYVPAEIESAVKDALIDAFDAGEEMTMAHVRAALVRMVPLSRAFATQIERMAKWAKDNATPASLTEDEHHKLNLSIQNRRRTITRRRVKP